LVLARNYINKDFGKFASRSQNQIKHLHSSSTDIIYAKIKSSYKKFIDILIYFTQKFNITQVLLPLAEKKLSTPKPVNNRHEYRKLQKINFISNKL